jgi:hypothetical protein
MLHGNVTSRQMSSMLQATFFCTILFATRRKGDVALDCGLPLKMVSVLDKSVRCEADLADSVQSSDHFSDHSTGASSEKSLATTSTPDLSSLGPYDVICGRHKAAFTNIGNRRFRITVALALERYMSSSSRKDKTTVMKGVAALVRSNGGRFLLHQARDGASDDTSPWVELGQDQTHQKVAHAFRDMATAWATKHKSAMSQAPTIATVLHGRKVPTRSYSTELNFIHSGAGRAKALKHQLSFDDVVNGIVEPIARPTFHRTAPSWMIRRLTASLKRN